MLLKGKPDKTNRNTVKVTLDFWLPRVTVSVASASTSTAGTQAQGRRLQGVCPAQGRCWMCWQAALNDEEYGTRLLVTLTEMYNLRISKQKSTSEPHCKANVTGDDCGKQAFLLPFSTFSLICSSMF